MQALYGAAQKREERKCFKTVYVEIMDVSECFLSFINSFGAPKKKKDVAPTWPIINLPRSLDFIITNQ